MPSHCHVFCHRGLPDIDPKRELLHFARGPDRHRELATPLQHDQAPRLDRCKPPASEVFVPAFAGGRLRHADRLRRPHWRNGQPKLTFHLDHSVGANQLALCEHLPGSVAVDTHRTVDDDANTLFERRKAVVGQRPQMTTEPGTFV